MVTDTSFYRNQVYHTTEDTADRLDYLRMSKVVVAVSAALRTLWSCKTCLSPGNADVLVGTEPGRLCHLALRIFQSHPFHRACNAQSG
jgi:hypothetical protein